MQLTISDLVVEIHDTHHPVSGWLYFEEQRPAARRRSKDFWRYRVPKYLGYFERVLKANGGKFIVGRRLSYVDLSLFQIIEGLRYAFPKHMKRFEKKIPGLVALHDRVARRPNGSRPISPRSGAFHSANGASIATSRSWTVERVPAAPAAMAISQWPG